MRALLYNPRARYLTGLAGPPWPVRIPRRRGMSAYNPRQRYLTGFRLGDDTTAYGDLTDPTIWTQSNPGADLTTAYGDLTDPTIYSQSSPVTNLNQVSYPAGTTGGSVVTPTNNLLSPSVVAQSIPATTSSMGGISPTVLLVGAGLIALLAAMGGN